MRSILDTDAIAAIGISSRLGLGEVRHIEVSQLWLQRRVANGGLSVQKVDGISNVADALTKHLAKGPLTNHMESVRLEIRDGRHPLMPVCVTALTSLKSVLPYRLKAMSAFVRSLLLVTL